MSRRLLLPLMLTIAACGGDSTSPEGPLTNADFAPELNVDLSAMTKTPSGLYWQDLQVGTGVAATSGATAVVHYTGWLVNGSKFDSSRDSGTPFSFQLGAGRVIAGWDEGVVDMNVGGMRKLVIPPDLAYGSQGIPPVIPGNATLVFDVELLDVQ